MPSLLPKLLEYGLFPGKPQPHFPQGESYEQMYGYWKKFWSSVFGELQPSHKIIADDLFRQDYVAFLRHGETPVGIHAYSFYDIRGTSAFEHSYFRRYYPQSFLDELKERNYRSVMTMEFFGVSPDWRSQNVGVSLAAVLVGTGLKLAAFVGADAVVTCARQDAGATKIAQNFGAESLVPNVTFYNVLCDLVIFDLKKVTPYPKPEVNELIEQFWINRKDYVEKPTYQETEKPFKKVA